MKTGHHSRGWSSMLFAAITCCLLWLPSVVASPRLPTDPNTVLEVLPDTETAEQHELRKLHAQLTLDQGNQHLIADLAWRYIGLARRSADPRYLGRAEAVVSTLSEQGSAPVHVLRATLLQQRHDFAGALKELDMALHIDPRNSQAWLTKATVLTVQGNYPAARSSCMPLLRHAGLLTATTCLASVDTVSGAGPRGYVLLAQAVSEGVEETPETRAWALTVLGEVAARLGKDTDAERAFREALALQTDAYSLAAYADFLLDRQRPAEVIPLLREWVRADGLLLRLVLAQQAVHSQEATTGIAELQARFAANRQRGEELHLGEEARFTLHVLAQPKTALELAKRNWAVQREPRDGRILLEAALAEGAMEDAAPVLVLLSQDWKYDQAMTRLAAGLGWTVEGPKRE